MDSKVLVLKPTIQTPITGDIPTPPSAQSPDHVSAAPNPWRLSTTPLHVYALKRYIVHYPNRVVANILIQGFSQGFKLHYHGPRLSTQCNNLKSADDHPEELKGKIYKEIQMGRQQGPYTQIPVSNLRLSPIGLVPKGDNSGWGLITHLSFPTSNSVNYYIDPN